MNKNLIKRVADRHEKKAARGQFQVVPPVIGAWFESLMGKLESIENTLAYANQIAEKEHKKLEAELKRKYGKTDGFSDEEYKDILVQRFYWVDNFWATTNSGRYANKFQQAISKAKGELQKEIHKDLASFSGASRYAKYEPSSEVAKTTLLKLFGERHADYGHGGYVFVTKMPRMGWDKVKAQLPRLLKDWKQGRPYEDQYESELMFENKNSWIKIVWDKRSDKVTVSTDDK